MNNFFRRNQKKLMAVFAAGLMIVFILPVGVDQLMGGRDVVMARAAGEAVTFTDLQRASQQWELLKSLPDPSSQFGAPLVFRLEEVALEIDPGLAQSFMGRGGGEARHPELFLLLQREAERAGVRVSDEQVQELAERLGPTPLLTGPRAPDTREALRALLLVQGLVQQYAGAVKVSAPMVTRQVALQHQVPSLRVAEFAAEPLKQDLPAPTTQQLAQHFQKYAAEPTSQPTDANPFGFGYRYPNRVKVQYIRVPRQQVVEAVRATKTPFEWQVEALRYYNANPQQFQGFPPTPSTTQAATGPATSQATTQPATAPADAATTEPSTTPSTGPTTGPSTSPATQEAPRLTTRPFEEMKERAVEEAMRDDVDAEMKRIIAAIQDRLTTDYQAFQKAQVGTGTTRPTTQPGGYGSFEHLQRLADDIQQRFKVRPAVTSDGEWKTPDELSALPGIGTASTEGGETFASLALRAEPLLPPGAQAEPAEVMSLYEPSPALRDLEENVYFFAVTAADPSHPPATMGAVAERVERDYRAAAAYEQALAAARKLLDAAQSSNLTDAAKAAGRETVSATYRAVPDFMTGRTRMEPTYTLNDPAARAEFAAQSEALLGRASTTQPHPVSLIELPTEGKVLVAELADVTAQWGPAEYAILREARAQQLRADAARRLIAAYFSRPAVTARMDFRWEEGHEPRSDEPGETGLAGS